MKNTEEAEGNFLGYLFGEVLSDKVHLTGCVACRSSRPSTKKGYPAIPDWKNELSELSSLIPTGKLMCACKSSTVSLTFSQNAHCDTVK